MTTTLDRYGGMTARHVLPPAATFRITRVGPRYLFATPEGNALWLKACYGIDITDGGATFVRALHAKYSHDPTYRTWGYWWPFVAQAVRNLRAWGFNALGEYTSNYALPVASHNRGRANSELMPFLGLTNAAHYAKQRYGVKDVMYGVDDAVTPNLWRVEGFPDVFDPAFARAVDELTPPGSTPWLLGTSTDDRDYLFGFGPGRSFGGWHNHLGWQAAATRPTQTSNRRIWVRDKQGVTYTDTRVYTKLALRDHLREKYHTLEDLNRAWGSGYTTWDTDGHPWPTGKGFLDESGRGPWLGRDFYALSDARPTVRGDLDAFVGIIADRYFSLTAGTLRRKRPGHLVFGPATISPSTHPEILRAAGRWCDAVQFSNEGATAFRRGYALTQKPFFVWTTFMAQADSPQAGTKGWEGVDYKTQEERGAAYARFIRELLTFRAEDHTYPCVGIDWWAYCDKITGGESHNFGLVTIRDNPYDGVAARVARGTNAQGYAIGGEAHDYGDFISAVTHANDTVSTHMPDLTSRSTSGFGGRLGALALISFIARLSEARSLSRRQFLLLTPHNTSAASPPNDVEEIAE